MASRNEPLIHTTKWTPKLIPATLPPNVQPELVEPYYRKNGEVIRTSATRIHEAVCLDPDCPLAFEGPTAFPEASIHTQQTGHLTRLYYHAEYIMQINPLHPKNRGKVKFVVEPDAPDLPPHLAPLYQQGPTGREPRTNRDKENMIQRRVRRQEVQAQAQELLESSKQAEAQPLD